jgi:tetratricopeptide (TPR) repeat protein
MVPEGGRKPPAGRSGPLPEGDQMAEKGKSSTAAKARAPGPGDTRSKNRKPGAERDRATVDFKEVDQLLSGEVDRRRIEQAVGRLQGALDEDPDDVEALVRVARAWVRLLERETGTVLEEKREYQPILDECGRKALKAAERAHELDPESADAIGWHLVSYGYYSIAIGIVRAFLAGAAGKYVKLAENLTACDETWLSGAAPRAMGRYYRESPWPYRDVRKAIELFRRAIKLAPKRQENKLHLALALIDNGQAGEARKLLEEVERGKPEPAEAHFHDAVVAFAREKLARL